MSFFLKINKIDNVGVAIGNIDGISNGHKKALINIKKGDNIIKYGNPIGHASKDIKKDEWVHTHNLKTNLEGKIEYKCDIKKIETKHEKSRSFLGYVRENNKVGIRNEIWIIPTVGCVNSIAKQVEIESLKNGISDVYAFTHPFGCSQLGEDHENTKKILKGLVNHPNAAGILVLGLGCENNLISEFKKIFKDINPNRVKFLQAQDVEDEIKESLKLLKELDIYRNSFKREKVDTSRLIVGLKCGGSDGLSGITANPLVGLFSDKLTAQGGSSILTEVPEMFGAEVLLMNRCKNKEIFNKTVALIDDFKKYYEDHNQVIYENPSPGNKEGGISTLEEKSLGCTQKSGDSQIVDVLSYGEKLKIKGLNLLSSPGNDLVATTALIASGAQIVLFTTGRGTPFGAPVPTVKISSNTQLYKKKISWIDFNAGSIVDGKSIESSAGELFEYIIELANGKILTKAEKNGYREISIFKDGVVL